MPKRAIFLDRDGTLTLSRHYPSSPSELVLVEGVGPGLRRLQLAGFQLVVITNQSGIARGYFTASDLERMHDHLREQLGKFSVTITAIYHCPHHVDGVVDEFAIECDCRKPEPGMLLQAAQDLDLSLQDSWFVGDILDDVEAGNRVGCKTILVDLGTESKPDRPIREPRLVATSTAEALAHICAIDGVRPPSHPQAAPTGANLL